MAAETHPALSCSVGPRSHSFRFFKCLVAVTLCSQAMAMSLGTHGKSGAAAHAALHLIKPGHQALAQPELHSVDVPHHGELEKRQGRGDDDGRREDREKEEEDEDDEKDEKDETTTSRPTRTATATKTSGTARSRSRETTSTGTQTSTTSASSTQTQTDLFPIPTDDSPLVPFDTSLNTQNMTSEGCPAFFDKLLKDDAYLDCIPISSLLKTSSSFFQRLRSLVRVTRTLDDACAAPQQECSDRLSQLAEDIASSDNCGEEVESRHPLVMQALNGFLSYSYVRDATCLKSPDTGNYCFADAITNTTNPSDSTIYHLPLGTSLPGGSRPTCNQCLQATMQVFSESASDSEQPAYDTYNPSAEQINIGCGPGFVQLVTAGSRALLPHMRGWWTRLTFILQYAVPFIIGIPLLTGVL